MDPECSSFLRNLLNILSPTGASVPCSVIPVELGKPSLLAENNSVCINQSSTSFVALVLTLWSVE